MNFYKCIFVITFMFIYFSSIIAPKTDLNLIEKGLHSVSPFAIGLQFYVVINNTSEKDYELELSPEQCCLKTELKLDCDTIEIIGSCKENIPKGTKKALRLVAPVLNPFERRGYCYLHFEYKLNKGHKRIKRDTIKIDFDTGVDNKKQSMDLPDNITKCRHVDQDPLNCCNPVQCDTYYNGRKTYYSEKLKRCLEVPTCVSNFVSELPSKIYDPISNACIDGRSILEDDIEFIKSLEKPNNNNLHERHDMYLPSLKKSDPDYYIMHNINNNSYMYDDLEPRNTQIAVNLYDFFRSYFMYNKYTVIVLVAVVLIQCCLICALIYYVSSKYFYFGKNKLVSKFPNYKADESLTTPLICSNTDTETTDYQYLSESSNNINKRIKSYKSCQKQRNNDIKISMSDDILSKCLNRRDWIDNKYTKSEAIPDIFRNYDRKDVNNTGMPEFDVNKTNIKEMLETIIPTRKSSETKVVFEDERSVKYENKKLKDRIIKNIVQKVDYKCKKVRKKRDKKDSDSSEKEIKCHSYDCLNINNTSNKPNSSSNHKFDETGNKKKEAISLSTEKGAQACFSNDSIDDFLSERGMMFLAGDDVSKYTFSCTSNHAKPSSSSQASSKTSKENIVKNMINLLHRRSKQHVSSDPGIATNENLDVELIHMSHASVFTSSNDSECIKEFRKTRDSRTSL